MVLINESFSLKSSGGGATAVAGAFSTSTTSSPGQHSGVVTITTESQGSPESSRPLL